jgi:hypothetical protein
MSRLTGSPYELGRSTGVCAATGEPLTPGDDVVAVLVEREQDGALDRLDYSLDAWEAGSRPDRLFCFWRRVIPESNAKPKPFIDDDELLSLFEQLGESDQPKQLAFRFILSLILLRKRLIRQVGSKRENGRTVTQVRIRRSDPNDPPIEVIDPGMDDEATAAAMEQLSLAMNGEAGD